MRGFLVGSLTLIVLQALTRRANTAFTTGVASIVTGGLHRLISADVAAIPNLAGPARKKAKAAPAPAPAQPSSGSTTQAAAPRVGQTITTVYNV